MTRVELIAVLGSLALLALILELIRERKLAESYSLLWLLTAVVLLVLSIWRELLDVLGGAVGIFYPPAALFVVGFGFVLMILLQFSVVITRLTQEHRELAQRVGLLQYRIEQLEDALSASHVDGHQ